MGKAKTGKQIAMLVIDDVSITSTLDKTGYREMGIAVSSVLSLEQALKRIKEKKIDVVLINFDHPSLDGADACQKIKLTRPAVHIIATSVRSSAKIKDHAIKAGVDLFVQQPIPRSYFTEQIKVLLEQKVRGGNERVSLDLGKVVVEHHGKILSFIIADLSRSGMLAQSQDELPIGAKVALEFSVPTSKDVIKCRAEVVRQVQADPKTPERVPGMGLKFEGLSDKYVSVLESFLNTNNLSENSLRYYL